MTGQGVLVRLAELRKDRALYLNEVASSSGRTERALSMVDRGDPDVEWYLVEAYADAVDAHILAVTEERLVEIIRDEAGVSSAAAERLAKAIIEAAS